MRDCQLLFSPYDEDQLIAIMETKIFKKYQSLPMKMKVEPIKSIFFNIVHDKSHLFIAKKVAKLNGDIRVAFDLMKTALSTLASDLSTAETLPPDDKI